MKRRRLVFVIDEYPYLTKAEKSFSSGLLLPVSVAILCGRTARNFAESGIEIRDRVVSKRLCDLIDFHVCIFEIILRLANSEVIDIIGYADADAVVKGSA